jgi:hypothetical protein
MTAPRFTRRWFLRVTGGGLAIGAVATAAPALAGAAPRPRTLPPANDGVQRIGRAYLRLRPKEARVPLLEKKLEKAGVSGVPREQLSAAAGRIAADFGEGRTVMLDGWVLSVTEARLAALDLLQSAA